MQLEHVAISRLHHPVTNLGYGQRAGIWLQGCSVHCPGCIAVDTWPSRTTNTTTVDAVLDWIRNLPDPVHGVSVSGGEPTDQPAALANLLDGLRDWADTGGGLSRDILLYTGRSRAQAEAAVPSMPGTVDALVSEPFVRALISDDALKGSSNQLIHPYSDLGQLRYSPDTVDNDYAWQRAAMGVHVDDADLWLVGIPLEGTLSKFRSEMHSRGVEFSRTSWLS